MKKKTEDRYEIEVGNLKARYDGKCHWIEITSTRDYYGMIKLEIDEAKELKNWLRNWT